MSPREIAAYVEQFGEARATWEREFATGRLTALELDELAVRLRGIKPHARVDSRGYRVPLEPQFKLGAKDRRVLATMLIESGHEAKAERLLSRSTWWRIRKELEHRGNGGLTPLPEPSPHAGLSVSKRRTPAPTPSGPSFHFDATSGSPDYRCLIRWLNQP